ncbi:hypothetical protein KVT40_008910 [Elsinoe batatas]|uniref:Fe2OG dioxygenase domain-containing protein n=1 Tax=Elsinoe batatas TaxID=2601811 RepID=A0A8K0KWA1_9PEZI|nr:hypothetical protein KVT40_008910 [Elsinoe batatas]
MDPADFSINLNPHDIGCGDNIINLLRPTAIGVGQRHIKAELYKLNVYSGPSGIFKAHVDTPRSKRQFGSLVICLPSSHKGGSLIVRHQGVEKVFDWEAASKDQIQWAAFYSDCEHEVRQVTSGHRVSLTYNLYDMDTTDRISPSLRVEAISLVEPVKAVLDSDQFRPPGSILGIYLAHSYAHNHAENILHLPHMALKGIDSALYEVFTYLGLKVHLHPVLDGQIDDYERSDRCRLVNGTAMEKSNASAHSAPITSARSSRSWPLRMMADAMRTMKWKRNVVGLNKSRWDEFALVYLTYGNEASMDYMYSAAAMFVELPGHGMGSGSEKGSQDGMEEGIASETWPVASYTCPKETPVQRQGCDSIQRTACPGALISGVWAATGLGYSQNGSEAEGDAEEADHVACWVDWGMIVYCLKDVLEFANRASLEIASVIYVHDLEAATKKPVKIGETTLAFPFEAFGGYLFAKGSSGIRYQDRFAVELCNVAPHFARAINARAIMSNRLPESMQPDQVPYCIRHPSIATEHTYRQVAFRYPEMKYQVGRACAVAGYLDLYNELELLPEVHIAEEARDSGHHAIFESIVGSPQLYSVMNDYDNTSSIETPVVVQGIDLNAAVRSLLDHKQGLPNASRLRYIRLNDFRRNTFNITEDMSIDEWDSPRYDRYRDIAPLLYSPLPKHLPFVQKDLLILKAAYNGDIDRYARLHRQPLIRAELNCLVRGIYHNVIFAKWCSTQPRLADVFQVQAAITARYIMCNDLSRVQSVRQGSHLPYCIWYPSIASSSAYEELARTVPAMAPSVVRAAIVTRNRSLFDAIYADADNEMLKEAQACPDKYFLDQLSQRPNIDDSDDEHTSGSRRTTYRDLWETTRESGPKKLDGHRIWIDTDISPYDGRYAELSDIDLSIITPDEVKDHPVFEDDEEFMPRDTYPGVVEESREQNRLRYSAQAKMGLD